MPSFPAEKFDCRKTLSVQDVLGIHEYVVDFFAEEDPVYPGVKSQDLLASAVQRPLIGCPNTPKYPDTYLAIATLTYGLTKNHPFMDGNKRTAVIAMLAFLDLWKLQFVATVNDTDLYSLMIALTENKMHQFDRSYKVQSKEKTQPDISKKIQLDIDYYYLSAARTLKLPSNAELLKRSLRTEYLEDADLSVYILSRWLLKYTRRREVRDRRVTLRELQQILKKFDAVLNQVDGTTYEVVRTYEQRKRGWLGLRSWNEKKQVTCYRLHVGGKNRLIGIDQIKGLRKACELDMYDYHTFYGDRAPADYFLIEHSQVLKRLSRYDKGDI